MKKYSIWLDDLDLSPTKKLDQDLKLDVLIIGGGITGLNIAYQMKNKNLNIALVEKNKIGSGITARTTGKLTFLQDDIYSFLEKNYSFNTAKMYLKSQKEAINMAKKIIDDNKIDCDLTNTYSYLLSNKKKNLEKEKDILKRLNIKVENDTLLNKFAIKVSNTAVFNPIKYLNALKEIIIRNNIDIYEQSCVTNIIKEDDYYICNINNKKVRTKKVVLACHYPFFLIPYFFPLKTSIEKSYVSASKINKTKNINAITLDKPIKSIRYYKDYFIYLTQPHNISFKNNEEKNFKKVQEDLNKYKIEAEYIWSNHDIITFDRLPFIGEIKKNIYIATGYNTWGMTNGILSGKIISDLILNNYSEYSNLFDPNRNKITLKLINYPLNILYNSKSFVLNKIKKDKSWYSNLEFKKIDGKNVAIYTDINNKKHVVYNNCPHLGCTLLFNEVEKTWDCPCHASRFDVDGNNICGPSKKDIKYK